MKHLRHLCKDLSTQKEMSLHQTHMQYVKIQNNILDKFTWKKNFVFFHVNLSSILFCIFTYCMSLVQKTKNV